MRPGRPLGVAVRAPVTPRTRIVILGMAKRPATTLRMLLAGPDWMDVEIVDRPPAEFAIVDIDTAQPERDWEAFRRTHPAIPALLLSLHEQQRENSRWLRKPFDAAALRTALDALRDDLAAAQRRQERSRPHRSVAQADVAVAAEPPPAPPPARRVDHAPTRGAARQIDAEVDERCCGTHGDVDLASPRQVASVLYDPPHYLEGLLEHAVAQVRATGSAYRIRGLPAPLDVLPGPTPMIATTLRDTVLRPACSLALEPGSMRMEPIVAASSNAACVPADIMLWNVALWTARGRLRRGLSLDTPVRLRRWPNFTRMIETPHAMRIVALLMAAPLTPRSLCRRLAIPQRQIFSVLSAAASVGLVERVARPVAAVETERAARVPPTAHRNLLSRILGRLVGAH